MAITFNHNDQVYVKDGKMGIGTISPSSLLHLSSNNSTYETNGILSVSGGVNAVFNSTERFIFNIDSDNTQTDRTFDIAANRTGSSGGNLLFRVQENGNVGIGETDPKAKLNITGVSGGPTVPVASSSDGIVRIESSNGGVGLDIGAQSASPYSMWMQVGNTSNSSGDTYPILLNPLGGNVGIGTTSPNSKLDIVLDSIGGLKIDANSDGGATITTYQGSTNSNVRQIEFNVQNFQINTGAPQGTSTTNALFIDSSQNVGIGTTDPSEKLHLSESTSNSYATFRLQGSNRGGIIDMYQGAYPVSRYLTDQSGNIGIYTSGAFGSTTLTEKVSITTAGNVGIGTSSPDFKLDVAGDIGMDGKLYHNGDHNTYIGFGGDTQTFRTGGSDRMTITNSGVGIGTTNPTAKLNVVHTASASVPALQIASSASLASNDIVRFQINGLTNGFRMFQDASSVLNYTFQDGNVGIGTTSPGAKLDITTDHTSQIPIRVTHNNYNDWLIQKRRSDDTQKLGIKEVSSNGSMALVTADSERVHITSSGYTQLKAVSGDSRLYLEGTSGTHFLTGTSGGAFGIYNNTASTYRMFINSGGNVGIGTTSPGAKLTVAGSAISISNGWTGNHDILFVGGSANSTGAANQTAARIRSTASAPSGAATGDLLFTVNSGDTFVDALYIKETGNVGIGTTSPSTKLHISGGTDASVIRLENTSTSLSLGDTIGAIQFYNNDDTDDSPNIAASIYATAGPSGGSGYLSFRTKEAGTEGAAATATMTLTNGGNVGIGNTSPQNTLHLGDNANASAGTLRIDSFVANQFWQLQPGTNTLSVKDYDGTSLLSFDGANNYALFPGGNVGIGTTSPSTKLHIEGASAGYLQTIKNTTAGGDYLQMLAETGDAVFQFDSGGTGGEATLNMYRDGTQYVKISADAGVDNYFNNGANVGIGTTSPGAKLDVAGNTRLGSGTLHVSTDQTFVTGFTYSFRDAVGIINPNGTSAAAATAVMSIGGMSNGHSLVTTGNVGIGLTSPSYKLDVYTAAGVDQVARFQSPDDGAFIQIRDDDTLGQVTVKDGVMAMGLNSNYPANTMLNILNSGNVGIGTTTPTHKLHVNGNMRLTGALRDSNNATGSAGQVLSSTGSATDWVSLPASSTVYTPKVYNLNNSTNINSQGQKLVPDFGTLEIEGNTPVQQVSGSDTDFQVIDENTGIYEVTYAVFYKNTGNQRTPLGTYLTLDGTAVNGSLMVNYLRANVTGGGNWSSCTNTFYVNVTNNEHAMALCVRRADSTTAPSGISMVEPAGMAVKSTISFRKIS